MSVALMTDWMRLDALHEATGLHPTTFARHAATGRIMPALCAQVERHPTKQMYRLCMSVDLLRRIARVIDYYGCDSTYMPSGATRGTESSFLRPILQDGGHKARLLQGITTPK